MSSCGTVFCRTMVVVAVISVVPIARAEPRTAKVAGSFYPDDPQELRTVVTNLLDQQPKPDVTAPKPRVLILPHAGYPYSGIVAARGFRQVQGRTYDGIAVVGFTHRDQFTGTSVDDREAYTTPLGTIPVDQVSIEFLKTQIGIHHLERAHENDEHSLEVMLPFLQVALGEFRLVPLLMGSVERSDAESLADALAALASRGDFLFVFSTDLSHYHPYERALERDELTVNAMLFETAQAVDRLFRLGYLEACGRGPIIASVFLAQRLGYPERRLLAYANSGDTAGDKSRVVGYAAVEMSAGTPAAASGFVTPEAGIALVKAARLVLDMHLKPSKYENRLIPLGLEGIAELDQARGLFVTLRTHGELRGCIGRTESDIPLAALLPTVALEAALNDQRFQPVSSEELDKIDVEVSVLSPPKPVENPQQIVAGRDGVILRKGDRGGVFLPQVWHETGWTRVEFLRELAHQKAGLEPDAWKDAALLVFQDQTFEERRTDVQRSREDAEPSEVIAH